MTGNQMNNLEGRLRELTTWHGGPPEVWKRALNEGLVRPAARGGIVLRILNWPAPRLVAACIGLIVIGLIATSIFSGELGKARDEARMAIAAQAPAQPADRNLRNMPAAYAPHLDMDSAMAQGSAPGSWGSGSGGGAGGGGQQPPSAQRGAPVPGLGGGGTGGQVDRTPPPSVIAPVDVPSNAIPPGGRHVIQKATIELKTDDVRSALTALFPKAIRSKAAPLTKLRPTPRSTADPTPTPAGQLQLRTRSTPTSRHSPKPSPTPSPPTTE